ncbi:MAG: TIGR03085 family metal-binding protein [Nocardioidaceae bacterium]
MRTTVYDQLPTATTGPPVSQVERALLVELLQKESPQAPTLCEGWRAHHLVAHLVSREGGPDEVAKTVLARGGDRRVAAMAASSPYSSLVERLALGPPRGSVFAIARVEPVLNTVEFLVHHEDVRRAGPDWAARSLPGWAEDQIWTRLRVLAKLTMRRAGTGVRLVRSGADGSWTVSKGEQVAVVEGRPSELALFVTGRSQVADVTVTGPDAAVAALQRFRPTS